MSTRTIGSRNFITFSQARNAIAFLETEKARRRAGFLTLTFVSLPIRRHAGWVDPKAELIGIYLTESGPNQTAKRVMQLVR